MKPFLAMFRGGRSVVPVALPSEEQDAAQGMALRVAGAAVAAYFSGLRLGTLRLVRDERRGYGGKFSFRRMPPLLWLFLPLARRRELAERDAAVFFGAIAAELHFTGTSQELERGEGAVVQHMGFFLRFTRFSDPEAFAFGERVAERSGELVLAGEAAIPMLAGVLCEGRRLTGPRASLLIEGALRVDQERRQQEAEQEAQAAQQALLAAAWLN